MFKKTGMKTKRQKEDNVVHDMEKEQSWLKDESMFLIFPAIIKNSCKIRLEFCYGSVKYENFIFSMGPTQSTSPKPGTEGKQLRNSFPCLSFHFFFQMNHLILCFFNFVLLFSGCINSASQSDEEFILPGGRLCF